MSFNELHSLLGQLPEPFEKGRQIDWTSTEKAIGLGLPTDYKQFIGYYGLGYMCRFIYVFSPFTKNPFVNLLTQTDEISERLRTMCEYSGTALPFPIHPAPGGLLPWGTNDNGDIFYWFTDGEPDRWTVGLEECRGPIERFDLSFSDLLSKLMKREIRSSVLGDFFESAPIVFDPNWK